LDHWISAKSNRQALNEGQNMSRLADSRALLIVVFFSGALSSEAQLFAKWRIYVRKDLSFWLGIMYHLDVRE
jgi:hypothetical protein